LADVLGARGWSVFWDGRIPVGQSFDEVIEREVTTARCVIVLWSQHGVGLSIRQEVLYVLWFWAIGRGMFEMIASFKLRRAFKHQTYGRNTWTCPVHHLRLQALQAPDPRPIRRDERAHNLLLAEECRRPV
jgi:hypothetical protein